MSKVLIDDEDIIVPEKVETVPPTEPKNYGPLVWAIVALVLLILIFYLYNYIQTEKKNGNI